MDEATRTDAINATIEVVKLMDLSLRRSYPWLKIEASNTILKSHACDMFKQILDQEPAMAESKKRTNFFTLSAELRNHIYGDALIEDDGEILVRCIFNKPYHTLPTLLQASKEIRREAMTMYYARNAFTFQWHGWKSMEKLAGTLKTWLESTGSENVPKIKELRILHRDEGGSTDPIPGKEGLYKALDLERLGITEKQFRAYYAVSTDNMIAMRIDREIL